MKITVLFACLAVGGTIGARLKRATGGKEIKIKDAPYFVSLKRNGRHVCGGAFISTRHVLTAAHCVLDGLFMPIFTTKVVSGTDVPDRINVEHRILNITAHDGFPEKRRECNIAVITLSAHVIWNAKQQEIALPNAEPQWETVATLVAFKIRNTKNSEPGLRELSVDIFPIDTTSNNPDHYGPIIYGTLKKPQSISNSDLGAALVYGGRIVGIASTSSNKNHHGCYFVNVLKFKTFIEQSMGMEPSPTEISWRPSIIDFDDIEWT